jgi:hypothetical protein
MSNVLTITRIFRAQGALNVIGTVALSGSYVQYANGGEVIDFTKAVFNLGFSAGGANMLPVDKGPANFDMWGFSGNNFGTGIALGLPSTPLQIPIKIFAAGSSSELSAGAYGAGQTGDAIQFWAVFDSLL